MKSTNIWCKMDINNRTLQCHDLTRSCDENYLREEEEKNSETENEEKSIICKHGYFRTVNFKCPICDRLK